MTYYQQKSSQDIIQGEYQAGLRARDCPPAQLRGLQTNRRALYEGLQKAESSALTQIRIGKIGLATFLYQYKVPSFTSTGYEYGQRRQDTKYILINYPRFQDRRQELVDTSGAIDAYGILASAKQAKRVVKQIIQTRLLGQFLLVAIQLY